MRFDAELTAVLTSIVSRLAANLTPAERCEVLRMAQGFACKDSANDTNVSPETVRARRKRIYRKLHVAGSNELVSDLLSRSLALLARAHLPATRSAVEDVLIG